MGARPDEREHVSARPADPATRDLAHDDAVASSLPWLGWCLSGLFVVVGVAYLTFDTFDGSGALAAVSWATALASAFIAESARRGRIPRGRAQLALSPLVAASGVLSLAHLGITEIGGTSRDVMLTMVGIGVGMVALRWVVGGLVALWAGWLLVIPQVPTPTGGWAGWVTGLGCASFLAVLVSTVRRRNIDALAEAAARAEAAAVSDPLTGLANRRGLDLLATPLLEGARRRGEQVHCLFVDVDGLKQVNDADGHGAGDTLLVAVAHGLRSVTRSSDVVARWAGDEFCVIGVGAGLRPDELEARLAPLAVTVGAAHLDPGTDGSIESVLAAADAAMYRRRHDRPTPVEPSSA